MIKVGDIVRIHNGIIGNAALEPLPISWIGKKAKVTSVSGGSIFAIFTDDPENTGVQVFCLTECTPLLRRILPEWF